jgi:hypothetical protein
VHGEQLAGFCTQVFASIGIIGEFPKRLEHFRNAIEHLPPL